MPQQLPEDLSGPAPRDGELSSELGCFRNFGSEAVQGLSEFLDSLLLCGDEAILFKRLLVSCRGTRHPFDHSAAAPNSAPHAPDGVFELSRSRVIGTHLGPPPIFRNGAAGPPGSTRSRPTARGSRAPGQLVVPHHRCVCRADGYGGGGREGGGASREGAAIVKRLGVRRTVRVQSPPKRGHLCPKLRILGAKRGVLGPRVFVLRRQRRDLAPQSLGQLANLGGESSAP